MHGTNAAHRTTRAECAQPTNSMHSRTYFNISYCGLRYIRLSLLSSTVSFQQRTLFCLSFRRIMHSTFHIVKCARAHVPRTAFITQTDRRAETNHTLAKESVRAHAKLQFDRQEEQNEKTQKWGGKNGSGRGRRRRHASSGARVVLDSIHNSPTCATLKMLQSYKLLWFGQEFYAICALRYTNSVTTARPWATAAATAAAAAISLGKLCECYASYAYVLDAYTTQADIGGRSIGLFIVLFCQPHE